MAPSSFRARRAARNRTFTVVRLEDLLPTILEVCGAPIPDGIDGESLLGDTSGRISRGAWGRSGGDLGVPEAKEAAESVDVSIFEAAIRVVFDGRFHLIETPDSRTEHYPPIAEPDLVKRLRASSPAAPPVPIDWRPARGRTIMPCLPIRGNPMTRSTLVLTLFALAIGGLTGFLVGGGAATSREISATAPAEPGARDRWEVVPARPAPPPSIPRAGGGTGPAGGTEVKAVETTGDGRIEGSVLDGSGNPLAGVRIVASGRYTTPKAPGTDSDDGSPPARESLEDYTRRIREAERVRRALRHEAVSDARGRFSLTNLPDRSFFLRAYLRGYRFLRVAGGYWAEPGDIVAFKGTPLVLVRVEVLLPDGKPAPEAKIHGNREHGDRTWTWTPADPVIPLEHGGWTLTAEGGPGETLASPETTLALTPDRKGASVVLRLEERTGIRGTVAFPPHFNVSYVQIELEPLEGQTSSRWERKQDTKVRPMSDRTFFFKDVPPGRYRVRIQGYDGPSTGVEIEVTKGVEEVALEVPPPDPRSCVIVNVSGPGGTPVPDVKIYGGVRSSKGSSSGGGGNAAIEPGRRYRYDFRGPDGWLDDDPDSVKRWIRVSTSLYGSRNLEVPPGTGEVTVSFEEAARVRLTLTGLQDIPAHRDLRVYLKAAEPGQIGAGGDRPGGGGQMALGPVQPGEYEIVLTVPFGDHGTMPLVRRSLTLTPGETELTIPVLGVYSLTAVWEGEGETHFQIRPAGTDRYSFPEGTKNGSLTWEGLPAGDYEVSAWGTRDDETRTVRVPAQGRVVFRPPPPPNCFVVNLSGPGRLAEVGLADGDRIIGVDGEEPEELEKLERLLAVASKRDSMTLVVLRGGERIEIPVAGSLITETKKDLGGRIRRGNR